MPAHCLFVWVEPVPRMGLEPIRAFIAHDILSVACLPFHHPDVFDFSHDASIVNCDNLDREYEDFLADCHNDHHLYDPVRQESYHRKTFLPSNIIRTFLLLNHP